MTTYTGIDTLRLPLYAVRVVNPLFLAVTVTVLPDGGDTVATEESAVLHDTTLVEPEVPECSAVTV